MQTIGEKGRQCVSFPRPAEALLLGRHDNQRVDISAKTDYAIRALLALAGVVGEGAGTMSVDALVVDQGLPRKFLESILADLRRGGLVTSRRGPGGGYALARAASQIRLGDVFRAVDGPLAEVRGRRPHETAYDGVAEHLPVVWVALRSSLRQVLDETTIEDVRTGSLPPHVAELAEAPDAWRNR